MGVNMKFKRKIYNNLLGWKNNRQGKTALLIEGVRRVGKSFVVIIEQNGEICKFLHFSCHRFAAVL